MMLCWCSLSDWDFVCVLFFWFLLFLPYCWHYCNRSVAALLGGSVAEWLACWTQAQKARVQIAVVTLSGNSLRQTVYTHRASVHQAAKLIAAFLKVAGVTAGLAESNGSLPLGFWLTSPAGWLPRTGINSGTLRSVIEYGLPFLSVAASDICYFLYHLFYCSSVYLLLLFLLTDCHC